MNKKEFIWSIVIDNKNEWYISYISKKLNYQIDSLSLNNKIEIIKLKEKEDFNSSSMGEYISVFNNEDISDDYISNIYDVIKDSKYDCILLRGIIYTKNGGERFNQISENYDSNEIYLKISKMNPIKKSSIYDIDDYFDNSLDIKNKYEIKKNLIFKQFELKISIVMSYYNRRNLLLNTLKSLILHEYKSNIEIIIVDDCSDEKNSIEDIKFLFPKLDIKIIKIEKEQKWWINPCVSFNIGFNNASGDIIIIQNPECMHFNNVIKYVEENIKENNYLVFGCYSLDDDLTEKINDINEFNFENLKNIISEFNDNSWYQHSKYRPACYHFCSAITKKDLNELGGFDEIYAHGLSFDDDDFITRIKRKKMDIFQIDNVITLHQKHENHFNFENYSQLTEKNKDLFKNITLKSDKIKVNEVIQKNRIPKRIFFYWNEKVMSWMRYMTIFSFRKMNPDWEIVLYLSQNTFKINKGWKTIEDQDYFTYKGENYFDKLKDLNIKIEKAILPKEILKYTKKMSPVHESDLFRYYQLYLNGGFYCDMDVLFFKPIDDFYKMVDDGGYDTIIHEYENEYWICTIGFLASCKGNNFYKDLFELGAKNCKNTNDDYQSMGNLLIYNMMGKTHGCRLWEKIIKKYKNLKILNLPTSLIYSYDWSKINYCFSNNLGIDDFGKDSIGYHWYGGGKESQKFNSILNENNYYNYKITFSELSKSIFNYKDNIKVSIVMSSFKRHELLKLGLYSITKYKIKYPFEIIVVNDGLDDDGTKEVCDLYKDKLNVKYIFSGQRNTYDKLISRPPAIPLNIGIKNSTGNIIILTCPEMFHLNDCVNKAIEPLTNNYDYLTIPKFIYFDDTGNLTKNINGNEKIDLNECNIVKEDTQMPFFMGIWKHKIIEIGGYDEDFIGYAGEDNDFVDRLKLNGCFHYRVDSEIIHLYHGKRCDSQIHMDNPMWVYNYNLYKERKGVMVRNENKNWGTIDKIPEISIVSSYYNRKTQFYRTLKSIEKSKFKNFEFIVVDDCSDEDQRIEEFKNEFSFLKVIRIDKKDKWYINPCVPFNVGIKSAVGNIIILQNPECLHVHDILTYAKENIDDNKYITISTYALNDALTDELSNSNDVNDFFNSLLNRQGYQKTFGISDVGEFGWYNHSYYLPSYFHFCSIITKKNMNILKGFDEKYAYGIGFDDNDFVDRIKEIGLKMIINDELSVIHQFHNRFYYEMDSWKKLHEKNRLIYNNKNKK